MSAHQYDELSPEASAPLSVDYWPFSKKSWPPRQRAPLFRLRPSPTVRAMFAMVLSAALRGDWMGLGKKVSYNA
jgi:hypothetical protein